MQEESSHQATLQKVSPTATPRFSFQVMFRKTGYIYGKVYITGWHFMDFPMPQLGDFELMVRGRYEGGDGPVRKIRIQGRCFRKWLCSAWSAWSLVAHLPCVLLLLLRWGVHDRALTGRGVHAAAGAVHRWTRDVSWREARTRCK